MGVEIERKFLVDPEKLPGLPKGFTIQQGYIQTAGLNTVRVRIRDDEAFLTLKSASKGSKRLEFEYPVPLHDAQEILKNLCQKPFISKTRYLIKHYLHTWELDIFEAENEGLIVAEIELQSEDETFELPDWVTTEVTGDPSYANSNLIQKPFSTW